MNRHGSSRMKRNHQTITTNKGNITNNSNSTNSNNTKYYG